MQVSDFDYELPPELIAQYPAEPRSSSRLLYLNADSGGLEDLRFADVLRLLRAGDLLVCNDTRVMPARLRGRKASGGRVEIMLDRVLDTHRALALIKSSRAPVSGTRIMLGDGAELEVVGRAEDLFELRFAQPVSDVLERTGEVPLPPYIQRAAEAGDVSRYQTVYARRDGAVAAPTAGLHFDASLMGALATAGIETAFVTLHVGAGTFQPVRATRVEDHRMHAEFVDVSEEVCARVAGARARGGRVVAVGTTAVRSLESACRCGELRPYRGDTEIFIYPGYRFRGVDAMITNFHLPRSTLLMLVAAFAGRDRILAAYRHAVAERYRFYSYGDAMFIGS